MLKGLIFQELIRMMNERAANAHSDAEADCGHDPNSADDRDPIQSIPRPDYGVIVALAIEAGGIEDRMQDVTTVAGDTFTAKYGRLDDRNVVLFITGAGAENAARATEVMLRSHELKYVLSVGFGGGLKPELKRNDIVMVQQVSVGSGGGTDEANSGDTVSLNLNIDPESLRQMSGVHAGTLLTADHLIETPDEKRRLGEKHDALAVDMESYAVAKVCRRFGRPLIGLRVILDTIDEQLPPDLEALIQPSNIAKKAGTLLGTVWRRPSSVKDMYRLRENAIMAADRLGEFFVSMLSQI